MIRAQKKDSIKKNSTINGALGLMLALSFVFVAQTAWFFYLNQYLPEPFVWDKANTFMDFYNPLYWSMREGVYSLWQSVYPPLNFIVLKFLTELSMKDLGVFNEPIDLRAFLDWHTAYLLMVYVGLVIYVIWHTFSPIFSRYQLFAIGLIALLSPPVLFAMERGNLIFISLWILAIYVNAKNIKVKSLSFAILVNLKPYFFCIYIFELLRFKNYSENKDFLFLAPAFSLIIFIFCGFIYNQEYYLLPVNLFGFSLNQNLFNIEEIFAIPNSAIAFEYLNRVFESVNIPWVILMVPRIAIYYLIIKLLKTFIQNKVDNVDFYIFIVLFVTNYSISTGGYSSIYYLAVMPLLFAGKQFDVLLVIIMSMFIGIWYLIPMHPLGQWELNVFLSGERRWVTNYLTLGSFVAPVGNFLALFLFYRNLKSKYEY